MRVLHEVDQNLQRQRGIDVRVGTVWVDVHAYGARAEDLRQVFARGAEEIRRRRRLGTRLGPPRLQPRHRQQVVDPSAQSLRLLGNGARHFAQLVVAHRATAQRFHANGDRGDGSSEIVYDVAI